MSTPALSAATQSAATQPTTPLTDPAGEETGSATATADADFETFLTLLTTQLRNQDPLKPLESTEFVAQLASFSAVEQQIETNTQLGAILEALVDGPSAEISGWIGRNVRAAGTLSFDGSTPLEVYATPPADAATADLLILGADGSEIARVPVDPTAEQHVWAGEGAVGGLSAGRYGFAVETRAVDGAVTRVPGEVFLEVTEARRSEDGFDLILADGSRIAPDDVTAIRAANSTAEG